MDHIFGNIWILTAAPVLNLGLLIDGVLIGSIFALAAYGLALVWGVMNVKNLAQGDFIMLGGYITWSLGRHGFDALVGVPVAFVLLWGVGWVVYRLVIRKVITRDLFTSLLATFGVAIVIQQSLNLAFGPDTQSAHSGLPDWQLADGLITISATRLLGFGLAILLALAVVVFSAGTDGTDGPTDAAGAVADGDTLRRNPQARRFLDENDSYRYFESLGDLVITGPTNTNVMDVRIILIGSRK